MGNVDEFSELCILRKYDRFYHELKDIEDKHANFKVPEALKNRSDGIGIKMCDVESDTYLIKHSSLEGKLAGIRIGLGLSHKKLNERLQYWELDSKAIY